MKPRNNNGSYRNTDSYGEGCELYRAGKFREAIPKLLACSSPNAFATLEKLGRCHKKLGEYIQSLNYFKKAEKLCNNDKQKQGLLLNIGTVYIELYKESKDKKYLESAKNYLDKVPDP